MFHHQHICIPSSQRDVYHTIIIWQRRLLRVARARVTWLLVLINWLALTTRHEHTEAASPQTPEMLMIIKFHRCYWSTSFGVPRLLAFRLDVPRRAEYRLFGRDWLTENKCILYAALSWALSPRNTCHAWRWSTHTRHMREWDTHAYKWSILFSGAIGLVLKIFNSTTITYNYGMLDIICVFYYLNILTRND